MRLHTLFLYTFLGLISSSKVFAQAQTYTLINGIKVEAVAVSSARIASNGEVLQGIQFRAQSGTTPPKFYERAVQFGKGTTALSVKNFVKGNAFQLGLTAGILGIGWALDSITGDIYPAGQTGTPALTCNPYYSTAAFFYASGYTQSSLQSAWMTQCNAWASYYYQGYCVGTLNIPSSGSVQTNFQVWCPVCQGGRFIDQTEHTLITNAPYTQPAIVGTPATTAEISDLVVPKIPPANLPKLHTDPNSGAVQKTQEVLNKATDVANQYARELNPESVNATAPTAAPLPVFQEKAATDTLPSTSALSLPDFCTWASFLCDAPIEPTDSNWTVASMITEEEIELETYSSGLGTGSCPSPEAFTVYGTSISYSYQPMCDLAGVARIFVLIFAYLTSIYILLGIRK